MHGGGSWRVVDRELVLGTWLTGIGEDKSDRLSIMSSWNRVFWKNAKYLTNTKASPSARLKFWKILSFGVSDFRFPGIRPCRKSGNELEAYFNKFVGWIVKIPPRDDDTAAAFCIRRNRVIGKLKRECNLDVRFRWCLRVVTWLEHLFRHTDDLPFLFLLFQDAEWLRSMRQQTGSFNASRSIDGGATGTRAGLGAPNRFCDGWYEPLAALGCFENPGRSKAKSKASANLLFSQIF